MKKNLILALILLFIATPAFAAKINFSGIYSIYSKGNLDPGKGIKLSLDWKSSIHPWLSYEETLLRFGGQEMADMQIYGGGFGIERKGWFAEFGYYMPKPVFRPSYKEALWLEINRVLQPSYLPANYYGSNFEYGVSGDFGVCVGMKVPVRQFFFSAMYRWLRFEDTIICRFNETDYWEVYTHRDFSGIVGSVGYEW